MSDTKQFKGPVPHSIFFLFDPENEADIPVWDASGPVQASKTCISVATLTEIDGDTTIELSDQQSAYPPDGYLKVFSGNVTAPHGSICINFSDRDGVICVLSRGQEPQIDVWINRLVEPDHIYVSVA